MFFYDFINLYRVFLTIYERVYVERIGLFIRF